jgi:hypothetical protein
MSRALKWDVRQIAGDMENVIDFQKDEFVVHEGDLPRCMYICSMLTFARTASVGAAGRVQRLALLTPAPLHKPTRA